MTFLYMLDTNTVSYILRNQSPRAQKMLKKHMEEDGVCISSITEAEIRYGLAKRNVGTERKAAVELFLAAIDIFPWDSDAALQYATARNALERAGKPLEYMDLMIAAHAAAMGAVLVTNDKAFHTRGEYLNLHATVNWADDLVRLKP